jgi:hypothetical protein
MFQLIYLSAACQWRHDIQHNNTQHNGIDSDEQNKQQSDNNGRVHFFNEGKSAASFCHQVAALVPDMFYDFYLVKNNKIANDSATTEAREKISTY